MPLFQRYIGIDYSGRGTSSTRTPSLQVYQANPGEDPSSISSPESSSKRHRNWCRKEVAAWLKEQLMMDRPFIAGIDHGFSLPVSYMRRFNLRTWPQFLNDFCKHWPTDAMDVSVDNVREELKHQRGRVGTPDEYRLTERWTSSAKSVFQFDVQGSVAKSTHAGIPWIQQLRKTAGDQLHCWPFDGWSIPPGKSVIAEVFPSIFRQRYPRQKRSVDAQDAYSVSRWLAETDQNQQLEHFFQPFLTPEQRKLAKLEGWILGIM